MKTKLFSRISLWFALTALIFATLPVASFAAELRSGEQTAVGSAETVKDDLYMVGSSVNSSGSIEGDIVTAGGNVVVTGPVSQSVNAAGGTITFFGSVGGSVRVLGGNITIESKVKNDVVGAGGQLLLTGGEVGRDVVVAGGSVRIDSPVQGKVRFAGGELYINAPIAGDVDVVAEKLTLGSKAILSGNLTYKSSQEVVIVPGGQIIGTVHYTPQTLAREGLRKEARSFIAAFAVMKLLILLVGAFVVGLLLRKYALEITKNVYHSPLTELGRGAVVMIVLPIVSVFLLITVVGIPFGVLGIIGFVAGLIFSSFLAPILLGSFLFKLITKQTTVDVSWKTLLLGVAVYFCLGFVPLLGWLVQFGLLLMAIGAVTKVKVESIREWR
ncbi:MAG: hypothetical protein WC817_03920 [Patescibacteria group bacterium]|jgi:hypothetical protein